MNVAALLASTATRHPDRAALVHASGRASYSVLTERVARLATGLRERLEPRSRVMLMMNNGPEFVAALWAAFWAGMVAVPVNRHLHAREAAYVADHAAAGLVIYDQHTRETVTASGILGGTLGVEAASPAWTELAAARPAPVADVRPDDPAWLFYTSGTTGRPKGATLTHRNLMAMTLNYYADIDPVGPDTVYLHAAPLSHGSGLYLLPSVGHGATNVIADGESFDPVAFLALADEHAATHAAFLAPTMLRRLTDAAQAAGRSPATLRHIMVGGAALYEQDLADAIAAFGPVVAQMYGQGESPMTIAFMPPELLTERDAEDSNWRSCGRPFTGIEVRIGDGPTPGEGEILVRGDVVMAGYWNDPEATARTVTDGWLATGDVGRFDARGFLYLTDRSKDVIISGGSNIYPREVEEALLLHPGVHEAVVVGVPDPSWGESVRAYVVPAEGAPPPSEAELIEHCRSRIASLGSRSRSCSSGSCPRARTARCCAASCGRRRRASAGRGQRCRTGTPPRCSTGAR
ncbi:class I adenylate-forming enzyme family protein [Actinocorallia sp. A-T 12471]|uniref:class I adenylate-forming enzyme family protein n=1 Tax=Actinocorallia sp. A-T 12471 TaxID=3089813 RepID=UPI0029CED093|nr:AMP-binding protein [Actinocorallia sp. A-T 12471]MDX6739577.1 AMP-binding protein [Actinocorallia sp. A-T 12471]